MINIIDTLRVRTVTWFMVLMILGSMTVGGVLSSQAMMGDGGHHDCPYMGVAGLCSMTPLEHLSQWQQMFLTTVQQIATTALLLLLALAVARHLIDYLFIPKRTEVFVPRYRYRKRVFDPLRLAFARGIIHPKVF